MASWYPRKNSPYLWVKWFDHQHGKTVRESTNILLRPTKRIITPCLKGTKEGGKLAQQICEEIEAAQKLDLGISYFATSKNQASIGDVFQLFKNINSNKDKSTIKNYELFFELFKKTFEENKPLKVLTKQSLELWLSSIRQMKTNNGKVYSLNYVYNFQKNLKKFLGYLFENEYLKFFKLSKDVQVKIVVGRKIIFKPDHIHLIFDNLHKANSNLRTCIYLLTYTGLRSTDILSIRAEDIDLRNKSFQYYSPKLKKHIIIPAHPELIPILKERLTKVAQGLLLDYSDHKAIAHALSRFLKTLELDAFDYSPRTFRKSFDTWGYENGMDSVANSRLVGHSINISEKHYREVYLGKLREELNKFGLPARAKNKGKADQKGTQKGTLQNRGS
ncbi:MAG: tyrosine-type recombinase/integrase [Candidatus Aquicultor sp.]